MKLVRRLAIIGLCGWMPLVAAAETSPAELANVVERYAEAHDFSGTVLVERDGRPLYEKSFGEADRAQHVAATAQTRYRIASITKLFTSTLVLQLVQEGRLNLQAPARTYLPELPAQAAGRATLHQLLNHTSGIAPFDTVASYQDAFANGMPQYQRPMTPAALLALCCSGPLVRTPGSAFSYNNADYIVLGAVIERVTHRSFEAALQERLLEPLALHATGMLRWDRIVEGLAPTYFYRDDSAALVRDMPVYDENWYAAGGMYSSAADLARFADALFGGHLLKPEMLEKMLAPGLDDYGCGLWRYTITRGGKPYDIAKRPGSIMGANAVLYRLLGSGTTVVILANTNRADQDVFAQKIGDVLVRGE